MCELLAFGLVLGPGQGVTYLQSKTHAMNTQNGSAHRADTSLLLFRSQASICTAIYNNKNYNNNNIINYYIYIIYNRSQMHAMPTQNVPHTVPTQAY